MCTTGSYTGAPGSISLNRRVTTLSPILALAFGAAGLVTSLTAGPSTLALPIGLWAAAAGAFLMPWISLRVSGTTAVIAAVASAIAQQPVALRASVIASVAIGLEAVILAVVERPSALAGAISRPATRFRHSRGRGQTTSRPVRRSATAVRPGAESSRGLLKWGRASWQLLQRWVR